MSFFPFAGEANLTADERVCGEQVPAFNYRVNKKDALQDLTFKYKTMNYKNKPLSEKIQQGLQSEHERTSTEQMCVPDLLISLAAGEEAGDCLYRPRDLWFRAA
jgi:hypothetical protein